MQRSAVDTWITSSQVIFSRATSPLRTTDSAQGTNSRPQYSLADTARGSNRQSLILILATENYLNPALVSDSNAALVDGVARRLKAGHARACLRRKQNLLNEDSPLPRNRTMLTDSILLND
jgi:hypothetical protein